MTAKEQVLKVYPKAHIKTLGYYEWYKGKYGKFVTTGYYIHIPTVWMPRASNQEQAWKIAYEKLTPNQMTPLQKSIAEIEANRNEKIKEIAVFDGWVKRDIAFTHGRELYENDHHTQWLDSMPYLTDLNALHRVALDVMDRLTELFNSTEDSSVYVPIPDLEYAIKRALYIRPINGQYTDLVDAVYDAIVYLKQHNPCRPK